MTARPHTPAPSLLTPWREAFQYIGGSLLITLAALPLAFVAAPSPWNAVGWVYLVVYGFFFLLGLPASINMLWDAVLVAFRKYPVYLPHTLAAYLVLGAMKARNTPQRRLYTAAEWAGAVLWHIHPLLRPATFMFGVALRARRSHAKKVRYWLIKECDLTRRQLQEQIAVQPPAELSGMAVAELDREFDLVCHA